MSKTHKTNTNDYNMIINRQEEIYREQDNILDHEVHDNLSTLKTIALDINNEIDEHNLLLEDTSIQVETLNTQTKQASLKIDRLLTFVDKNKSSLCIVILLIILGILILIYFHVL